MEYGYLISNTPRLVPCNLRSIIQPSPDAPMNERLGIKDKPDLTTLISLLPRCFILAMYLFLATLSFCRPHTSAGVSPRNGLYPISWVTRAVKSVVSLRTVDDHRKRGTSETAISQIPPQGRCGLSTSWLLYVFLKFLWNGLILCEHLTYFQEPGAGDVDACQFKGRLWQGKGWC